MKIFGTIISKLESADIIEGALSPDNCGYMECVSDGNTLTASVSGESVKTVLATVDDYLMNLSVACKTHDACSKQLNK